MKYAIVNQTNPRAMRLQSIGLVLGTPAGEIKEGDFLMWNWGYTSEILKITKTSEKMIFVKIKCSDGSIIDHKFNKKRLVCILQK